MGGERGRVLKLAAAGEPGEVVGEEVIPDYRWAQIRREGVLRQGS
jgi:hypothetical protein